MPETTSQRLDEQALSETFQKLGAQVTKKDKYQACIDLGRGDVPLDIKTVETYLKGTVNNVEFGNSLYQYFASLGYTTAA